MATLLLQVAGTAIGTMVGGPMGAAVGAGIGAVAGGMLDRSLFGQQSARVEGPRLNTLDGISATEGAPIPRMYGRVRLGGQIIWATKFEEQVETRRQGRSGGKSSTPTTTTTTYTYFANFAVALCEGPIAMVRRVWADGKPLDLTSVTMRVYRGTATQLADPLIVARQGSAPAYRGTAYVVFERMPLAKYGNRMPQLSFVVVRPVDGLAQMIRGVDLIPGATEFGYDTSNVIRNLGYGGSAAENRNQLTHTTDLDASLDALDALCPNANSVAFVASWFGDDLRAGMCRIVPGVDSATKDTGDRHWSVAGLDRSTARLVTQINGRAAYGGTPSDTSVISAIVDLQSRGKSVVYYPFVMMDVAPGNTLPDPWGAPAQAAFPWRGRITCHPAPGQVGSPDGTAAAAAQIAAFFGTAKASDFAFADGEIVYSGPDEWSYSRFLLHNAMLVSAAGGVDAFLIGSEFVSLTRVRGTATGYAATEHFVALAAELRLILPASVKLGYAADWTEYGAHVRNNGADVGFPLDPLWASPNIDFIGIDYYPPVADWREGTDHLDAQAGYSGRDVAYFKDRFGSGEAFDWFYASNVARDGQIRTPITDGAYGKPWIYRAKDLKGWWSNAHMPRIASVEQAATAWVPQSKPIWLTEVGCPAVDKGGNSPNLFIDPKSSESGYPPYSARTRDDLVQTRFLEAAMRRFDPTLPGFVDAHNPLSAVYGGRMVDPARIHVWAWDARPYPAFPHLGSVWGDAENWLTGHWLNGRIEGAPLDRLIAQICSDFSLPAPMFNKVDGFVDGYVIERPMSARAALEPLTSLFGIDVGLSEGVVKMTGRGQAPTVPLTRDDLVADRKGYEIIRTRAQETELPRQITLGFSDAESQYKRTTALSRRLDTASRIETAMETTAVLTHAEGQRLAEQLVQEAWTGRESAEFSLRPGLASLECGDLVALPGETGQYRLTRISDGLVRTCEAQRTVPAIYGARSKLQPLKVWPAPRVAGPPMPVVISLAADPVDPTPLTVLALAAEPWVGPYTVWRSLGGASFEAVASVERPSVLGQTLTVLPPGPLWHWDRNTVLDVKLANGALEALDEESALAGKLMLAIEGGDGLWEICSFRDATLLAAGTWRLSYFLRGLYGSEPAVSRPVAAGARVVVLRDTFTPLFSGTDAIGATASFRVSAATTDYADPSAAAFTATASNSALLPYAPVQATARRSAMAIRLSWIRRTRRGGDNWDLAEVPLSEDSERYTVEVLENGAVKRSETVSAPLYEYSLASELADFGTAQSTLSVRIRQLSAAAGAGAPLVETLAVLPG